MLSFMYGGYFEFIVVERRRNVVGEELVDGGKVAKMDDDAAALFVEGRWKCRYQTQCRKKKTESKRTESPMSLQLSFLNRAHSA